LVAFENTHNACGGTVVPQSNIEAVAAVARAHGIALHLDGARLMNASIASGTSPAALAAPFDTVSLCLSKGLGAPVGSLLAGSRDAISRARRTRKLFGGGMRQAGILAAAGLHALDHHVARLYDDHRRAWRLAEGIAAIPGLVCNLDAVQTNLVFFDIAPDHKRMRVPLEARTQLIAELKEQGVLLAGGPYRLRAVTHLDVDDAGIDRALQVLRALI
jgi:threonine aldolase